MPPHRADRESPDSLMPPHRADPESPDSLMPPHRADRESPESPMPRRQADSDSPASPERQSTWLELFFDLVLVAAVAALAGQLHADHSVAGLAVFAGLFVPVWWAWWGYTWFSAGFDTDDRVLRLSVLAAMVAVAAASSGIGRAAHGDSRTFVVAYAGVFLVLAGLYARAWVQIPRTRALTAWYAAGYAAGAAMWLGSLAFGEPVRPVVWGVGMVLLMVAPVLAARALPFLSYDPRHIAERYGLFTLIVLGESIVVTASGLDTRASAAAALTAVLGFVIAAVVWWVYFGRWRAMPAGGIPSGWVWAQGHLFIFAGIAAAAVGVEFCVEAAAQGRPLELADRLPLGAGLAAYLTAMAAIRAVTRRPDWVVALRVATGLAVLLLALLAAGLPPLAVVGLSAALMVGEALVEMTRAPAPADERPRFALPHETPRERGPQRASRRGAPVE